MVLYLENITRTGGLILREGNFENQVRPIWSSFLYEPMPRPIMRIATCTSNGISTLSMHIFHDTVRQLHSIHSIINGNNHFSGPFSFSTMRVSSLSVHYCRQMQSRYLSLSRKSEMNTPFYIETNFCPSFAPLAIYFQRQKHLWKSQMFPSFTNNIFTHVYISLGPWLIFLLRRILVHDCIVVNI